MKRQKAQKRRHETKAKAKEAEEQQKASARKKSVAAKETAEEKAEDERTEVLQAKAEAVAERKEAAEAESEARKLKQATERAKQERKAQSSTDEHPGQSGAQSNDKSGKSSQLDAPPALPEPVSDPRRRARDQAGLSGGGPSQLRLVRVGHPEGWFLPTTEVVLEVKAKDGTVSRWAPLFPIPFPFAWAWRIARRLGVPLVRSIEPEDVGFSVPVPRR